MTSDLALQAERAIEAGQLDLAEQLCRSLLKNEPENLSARLFVGVIAVKRGQFAAAIPTLERAARDGPTLPLPNLWLSRAYRRLGDKLQATKFARIAVELGPQSPAAQFQLATCLLDASDYEGAIDSFTKAVAADPRTPTLHHGLGLALQGLGRNSEAIHAFRRAAQLAPTSVAILASLYQALADESDSAGALDCARELLNTQPSNPENQIRMARALIADNKALEAQTYLDLALRQPSPNSQFAFAVGTLLQSLGRLEEAEAQFRHSIQISPVQGFAYAALAYNRKLDPSFEPMVLQMQKTLEDPRLPHEHKSYLHYALGKSFEDLMKFESAMDHFDEANRLMYQLKFGDRAFDSLNYSEKIETVVATTNKTTLDRHGDAGSDSGVPVFVVGMLRSGTTLVEQILSSHPEVGAGGEQGFWLHNRNAAMNRVDRSVDEEELLRLANTYLNSQTKMWPNKARVIDKMPDNYLEIAMLHMAFPKAKILHCTRSPRDTCISIYTTINRLKLDWAHNKRNIVFVYSQYLRLMEHWKSILPTGVMMDVSYERLVENREQVTRELVDFCGLDWNDACLMPESNKRTVSTPSVWQVRQPVYNTSIGRWKNYEPWLGEFRSLLP